MTWVIKILNRDFTKIRSTWTGATWNEVNDGLADYMINDFQFSESTWREVSYTPVVEGVLINRESLSADKVLTETSARYQMLDPQLEEIYVTLPARPQFNERYIIKNNSEVNNKLLIREVVGGPVIFTLDSLDEFATLFHDGIEYHIAT